LAHYLVPSFFFGQGFEVHRASETGNVLIARLVCSGEQEEVVFPGVVEGHGCFLFL
jgi:hypothetical protein